MALNVAFLIAGFVLLTLGAEGLVRGATGLALRAGISALAIGLTVVAIGTGSPELVLSVQAAAEGHSGIALGNVVGSNIGNIALVLGVAALVRPMRVRTEVIRREAPLMIGATAVLAVMLMDGGLSRLEGALLLAGEAAYLVFAYLSARTAGRTAREQFTEEAEADTGMRSPWVDALLLAGGIAGLVIGASLLLRGGVFIANSLGVSQVVIGLTILAIGTSLPELATSVVASSRDNADVAVGNAIGSNMFNILGVLGAAALIRPFSAVGLRPLDMGVMVATAILIVPIMWRGSVLSRGEGAMLVAGYAFYVYSLVV